MTLLERTATAPISWGICEVPGWGYQMPPSRVLAEMSELGFTHTELGSYGWLPTEVEPLTSMLREHDLSLLAAFVPLVLHRPEDADKARANAREAAELLRDGGASVFVCCPVMTWEWGDRRALTDDEWQHLVMMLAEIDAICAEHGLTQALHEHVGATIETDADVMRLVETSDVKFVLDTGHLTVGGCSPLEFVRTHPDRVGLVHLKDTVLSVADQLNAGEVTLMEAVQAGLFPALGAGDVPVGEVITTLEASGYDGWYVVEQDAAITDGEPPAGEGPIRDVARSVSYLRSLEGTDGSSASSGDRVSTTNGEDQTQ